MSFPSVRWILLDVEGTTSSIAFVYDVMFPFVRRRLDHFLRLNLERDDSQAAIEQLACDSGLPNAASWRSSGSDSLRANVAKAVISLMDADSKATGLKMLQGMIWKEGFASGELVSHLFDDVAPCLRRWRDAGLRLAIYSSGSVVAQRLFFGNTQHGDLTELFDFHFDTTFGGKKEISSYVSIAKALETEPASVLFLSDVAAELDAAKASGMHAIAVVRPGNALLPSTYIGPQITNFNELVF